MKSVRANTALAVVAAGIVAAAAAPAAFPPADTIAIYKAAGFVVHGSQPLGCNAGNPDWPPSSFFIEAIDLSGDGKPEAIVTEGNIACYGGDEQAFTIVAKAPDGSWRRVGGGSGGTAPLKTRHNGWLDLEYGGPGMEKKPVLRWTGSQYK